MSKVIGIYVKFWHFYDACSPNMTMSRGPRRKFRKSFIFPNSAFNIRKSYKLSRRKSSLIKKLSAKNLRGGGKLKFSTTRIFLLNQN